ncbi:MAG TPA: tetratricopeptide repeat protein, partial [Thermoanaerobaculia bacterium]|nr:tetratricopeptide repeat protein [Thermoanaerobaculia bacterium]
GDAARDDGRLQEARRLYRRARHRGPRHPEVLAALGELALAEQRERAARRWLRRAQAADPHSDRVQQLAAALPQR